MIRAYDDTTDALYGSQGNPSYMPATMLNPGMAQSETDWGAILANGIRGAADGAIGGMVAGGYASGQLIPPGGYPPRQANNMLPLLMIGAVVYLVMKG